MTLIVGVIRPSVFEEVKAALRGAAVNALAVAEIRDYAVQNQHGQVWRGLVCVRDDVLRLEVKLAVEDGEVDDLVSVILRTARTRGPADGYVTVMPADDHYSVHTGYRGIS